MSHGSGSNEWPLILSLPDEVLSRILRSWFELREIRRDRRRIAGATGTG